MEIRKNIKLYAIIHRKDDWKDGLDFITPSEESMQVGTFLYNKGKQCNPHKHLFNPRNVPYTQECFIVLDGSVLARVYDEEGKLLCEDILISGDMIVLFAGGHGFEILQDGTRVIECKSGPFTTVSNDKVGL